MAAYFPEVTKPIPYEGPDSKNPLAFRWYDANRKVRGKTMEEHLSFAIAYWHTFKGTGADPFGGPVYDRPWSQGSSALDIAEKTLDAAFEFFTKLGVKYYCFHDHDIAPEGGSLKEGFENLDAIVAKAEKKQQETGVSLLWGTAKLFGHRRYTHGAATNPDPKVFACAAAQVRHALEATHRLGGRAYVFWGGREGYSTLLNTDLKHEQQQMARFLHLACDHADAIGFDKPFFIEPKPKEPTTHQYDFDAATTLGFLREHGLLDRFMLNIEANHATLAGHAFEHDLAFAAAAGKLGSCDVNRGNLLLGWDTDQFPTDLPAAVMAMSIILQQGGLAGGLNFDAHVRRGSFDTVDLFHAHIGGMDTFARGLLIADKMLEDGALTGFVEERYAGWKADLGKKILAGDVTFTDLEDIALQGEPEVRSGREEMLENVFNDYLYGSRVD